MLINHQLFSLKAKLNKLFWLISSIIFIIACAAVVFLLADNNKKQAVVNTHQWANVIAHQSVKDILDNDKQHLNDNLQILAAVNNLNYVFIYKLPSNLQTKQLANKTINQQENQPVEVFSVFKQGSDFFTPPNTIQQLQKLQKIHFTDTDIELVYPIKNEQGIIGFLYIQFDKQDVDKQTLKDSLFIIFIIFIVLFTSYMIINRFLEKILAMLKLLSHKILTISKQKDFSMRCEEMPYQEINVLAQHINLLLQRADKYIEKRAADEQEFIQLNKSLEDKVNQRTQALKESNQELLSTLETLHQYQGQLVESEKMASLGDMVAGVAHEVNTPIGLGVTSSSLLYDKLTEIKQAFENKTLKSSQLKKFLNDGEENLNIIMRNLARAADLITSFKKVAVDQSSSEDRRFNFKGLIDEVILTLQPQLKNTHYKIDIDCPENLIVTSKPGPINQILVNLIINSIIHGFDNQGHGKITIAVMDLNNQLYINYQDNGKGINSDIKNKIFEPFITTKRGSGGSGLGMHLVYNLITQALNGTISFESEPNNGVVFDINFPIEK